MMERRTFLKNFALTGAAGILGGTTNALSMQPEQPKHKMGERFTMNFAPHFGMFKNHAGDNLIDQIQFAADTGFHAWEDNGMKNRTIEMQENIARTMAKNNMDMGVFVAHTIYWNEPNLASGDKDKRDEFLKEISESVEVAKRVNAKWMTVVPGHVDMRKQIGFQTANVVDTLRRASDILEKHNLVMVLEPLNFRDHPGLFLTEIPQAYQICQSVKSPSCKILFDIYHQQIQEGNIIPNIDGAWEEVAYFQIGDNPGRKEPTTGEINYENVFKHIHEKKFPGVLGMEHGNSQGGKAGELALIEAYRQVDFDS